MNLYSRHIINALLALLILVGIDVYVERFDTAADEPCNEQSAQSGEIRDTNDDTDWHEVMSALRATDATANVNDSRTQRVTSNSNGNNQQNRFSESEKNNNQKLSERRVRIGFLPLSYRVFALCDRVFIALRHIIR